MFHRELESGKLLLSPCPDSTKLVTTHAISFIAKGETRQKRWSCGRVEGWGFLAETGGVAGSVWGMSLLWWWGCGLAGHDFIWNEGFIDFTTQGQRFPNSATSSNLQFGELGLGNVCRLLDSCGLPLWSRVFQTKWITYTTSAGVSTVHFRQSRQPAGTTTRCFGNHDARQTLSWDNLGWNGFWPTDWRWWSSCVSQLCTVQQWYQKSPESHQASQQLSDYGDHASHLEIQYNFVWKCNIITDLRMLDGFCWPRNFIYVYACTRNISCITKWQDGGRETHFLNA